MTTHVGNELALRFRHLYMRQLSSFLELVSVESGASELYETLRKLWSDRT